ncbi:MAG: hypothetical protein HPY65_19025 [Syntrophaceae bacterium]|nr:hypothetical protein [Syntrophaceae bacterium]
MKRLIVATFVIFSVLMDIPVFAFSFRGLTLDTPIDKQMKICEQESKELCYLKLDNDEYKILNLPELSIKTETVIYVYGDDNKIGLIKVTFNGKDADKFFSLLLDKYGPPKTVRGKIPKRIILNRKTGKKIVIQSPTWSLDDCYMVLNDIDEMNLDNGKLIIGSKKIIKVIHKKKLNTV